MTDFEQCARCGRQVGIDSDDFVNGESIDGKFVCDHCITGGKQQDVDDDMAMTEALDDAGLGGSADIEAMSDDELDMRDDLAQTFYEQDRGEPT